LRKEKKKNKKKPWGRRDRKMGCQGVKGGKGEGVQGQKRPRRGKETVSVVQNGGVSGRERGGKIVIGTKGGVRKKLLKRKGQKREKGFCTGRRDVKKRIQKKNAIRGKVRGGKRGNEKKRVTRAHFYTQKKEKGL